MAAGAWLGCERLGDEAAGAVVCAGVVCAGVVCAGVVCAGVAWAGVVCAGVACAGVVCAGVACAGFVCADGGVEVAVPAGVEGAVVAAVVWVTLPPDRGGVAECAAAVLAREEPRVRVEFTVGGRLSESGRRTSVWP
ncbi:MAG: hypothetical protein ABSD82_04415 [Solirubrobacteraceae bacterium]